MKRNETHGTSDRKYVVTFNLSPVIGLGALDGLARMTLEDARYTIRIAARIPKQGVIIDSQTLEPVK